MESHQLLPRCCQNTGKHSFTTAMEAQEWQWFVSHGPVCAIQFFLNQQHDTPMNTDPQ